MSEDEEQSEEKENSGEQPEGSLMEGQLGAGAVKRDGNAVHDEYDGRVKYIPDCCQ